MPLPYRTVLRFPASVNLQKTIEQELQSWIESKRKIDRGRRAGFLSGEFFDPGHHQLSSRTSLAVARSAGPSSGNAVYRFLETSPAGDWQVDLTIASDRRDGRRTDQLLMVSAVRLDEPEASGQVDPPGIVRQLLDREEIYDSKALVTGHVRLSGLDDVAGLVEAILDPDRSVSVVVGASFDPALESRFVEVVDRLTAKLSGAASVMVLRAGALDAFNQAIPEGLGIEPGHVRTYLSEVDTERPSEVRRHRILSPQRLGLALDRRGQLLKNSALPSAFAQETREPMLSRQLPASLRRAHAELSGQLDQYRRTAILDAQLARPAKALEKPPAASVKSFAVAVSGETLAPSVLTRLRSFIARWLGPDRAEVDEAAFDELDHHFVRASTEVELLMDQITSADAALELLADDRSRLETELSLRSIEFADVEVENAKLKGEVQYLRRTLAEQGSAAEAYRVDASTVWNRPEDLTTLVLRLDPSGSDPVAQRVVFTGDFAPIEDLERRVHAQLYAVRCWDFVRVLHDYAQLAASGDFAGGMRAYLLSTEHDGFKVSPKRHAAAESQATMNQFGDERLFSVPTAVDSTGQVHMPAHFKIDQSNTVAPRLHYFDDVARTGRVYIGYIGPHLSNTKTKNS